MPAQYSPPSKELLQMAEELIVEFHPDLVEYADAIKLAYCFVDTCPVVSGQECLGTCKRISGYPAYLYGLRYTDPVEDVEQNPYFNITIWEAGWASLSYEQKRCLLDHELEHILVVKDIDKKTGELVFKGLGTRHHDIGEFRSIVDRHGLIMPDVEAFALAVEAAKRRETGEEDGV